ncbi:hypothetical protein JTE90_024918 [Oedothorax gibbosus]|uniref:Uncharacterized protein n=1 Tax=Oedothorax gibbosus TaxID=931172 RepID=A0AAV6TKI6_9ARAC|nr:hypothetical protein JTE90_024918 [Oedothorax gibbosus]
MCCNSSFILYVVPANEPDTIAVLPPSPARIVVSQHPGASAGGPMRTRRWLRPASPTDREAAATARGQARNNSGTRRNPYQRPERLAAHRLQHPETQQNTTNFEHQWRTEFVAQAWHHEPELELREFPEVYRVPAPLRRLGCQFLPDVPSSCRIASPRVHFYTRRAGDKSRDQATQSPIKETRTSFARDECGDMAQLTGLSTFQFCHIRMTLNFSTNLKRLFSSYFIWKWTNTSLSLLHQTSLEENPHEDLNHPTMTNLLTTTKQIFIGKYSNVLT